MDNNKHIRPGIIFTDDREKVPNERQYIVLLRGDVRDNESLEYRDFEWVVGRQKLYDYLKDLIVNEEDVVINIHTSIILSETHKITDHLTVYEFMKAAKNMVIDETGFDIEEYNIEGDIEYDQEA